MTDNDRVRALRAQALLDDDVLKEAFEALERRLIDQCKATAPGAASLREETWGEIRALQSVRTKLRGWATDLTVAARKADRAAR